MAAALLAGSSCRSAFEEGEAPKEKKKENTLKIGWASADISTTEPVLIAGQFHARISKGVLDPVTATALWMDNGKDAVCFVSADLVSAGNGMLDEVSALVKKRIPSFPVEKIIISGTHTHAAPVFAAQSSVVSREEHNGDLYKVPTSLKTVKSGEYRKFLFQKLSDIICKAYENRKEGGFAYGYGSAQVGHNRRAVYKDDFSQRKGVKKDPLHGVHGHAVMYGNTKDKMFYGFEGGADPTANFLFTFDAAGTLTGALINVSCPSQHSSRLEMLSADYWHNARAMIRKKYGNIFLLPQCGAAGDTAPVQLYYNRARARRDRLKYGRTKQYYQDELHRIQSAEKISDAFDEVYAWAKKEIFFSADMRHEVKDLELPLRKLEKADRDFAVSELERLNKIPFVPEGDKPEKALWTNSRLVSSRNRSRAIIARWKLQQEKVPYRTQIHVLHIGDLAFASNQFELYQDYQHRIQGRSPFAQTVLIQLAGVKGPYGGTYLATKRSVENKGYGSERFSNRVSWEGGDRIVDETVSILEKFKKESVPAFLPAGKRTGKIRIDGVLDEEDWKKAEELTNFVSSAGDPPSERTFVKLLLDEKNLYIGIKAMTENFPGKRVFKEDAGKRDGAVWQDDSVEIMLGLSGRRTHNHYMLNTAGVLYDGKAGGGKFDPSFTSRLESCVKKYPDCYVAEIRIPLADLGKEKGKAEELRLNLVRNSSFIQMESSSLYGIRAHDFPKFLPLKIR